MKLFLLLAKSSCFCLALSLDIGLLVGLIDVRLAPFIQDDQQANYSFVALNWLV
jgi:hypothetical protein